MKYYTVLLIRANFHQISIKHFLSHGQRLCYIVYFKKIHSPSVMLHVGVSAGSPVAGWPGRYINVWHCGVLSTVLLQVKDPLELFGKRREFLASSGVLSCRNMT